VAPDHSSATAPSEEWTEERRAVGAFYSNLVNRLYSGTLLRPGATLATGGAAAQVEEWKEEREAVSAIYGDAASFPSDSRTSLRLDLPFEVAQLLRMKPLVGCHARTRSDVLVLLAEADAGNEAVCSSKPAIRLKLWVSAQCTTV